MKVLIACEFSGIVRDAFAAKGHEAWSCDLLPSEKPGNHIQGDVLEILDNGWDLMIAFPPCTHLAVSGAAWFKKKQKDGRQQEGIDFFMSLMMADPLANLRDLPEYAPKIKRIAVENPVGIMSSIYRKPNQIIQPYYFGDEFQKTTCLWLKNLPLLFHAKEATLFDNKTHVGKGEMVTFKSGRTMPRWYAEMRGDGKNRSKTFPGIANAMAEQWG